jgi:dihydrofolate reductase
VRKLIAAMKNPRGAPPDATGGDANWVRSWSQDFGLTPQIDACLLGGGMYPGYEEYWTALQDAPDRPLPTTGKYPTQGEIRWARFIAQLPHYVLSNTLTSARWRNTHFLRRLDEVSLLKRTPGKGIYLVGDAHIVTTLIDADLVDELRLIVDPLIVGSGQRADQEGLVPQYRSSRQRRTFQGHEPPDGETTLLF